MKDPSDTSKFILVPLLEGIPGFEELTDNTFKIRMTNGKDITEWNYINIKDQNRSLIDVPVNFPSENNIKQKVIVYSDFRSAVVIPNPTSPSFEHTGPGVLNLRDDRDARRFARDGKGAAINVVLPNNKPGETVTAHIKIYDIAGNIVNTSYNNDFLKIGSTNTAEVGSNTSVDIYWNGSNSKGMKVAPGIYKTVLYFSYSKHSIKNLRFILNIGMKK
jgi:hypothetical protein